MEPVGRFPGARFTVAPHFTASTFARKQIILLGER